MMISGMRVSDRLHAKGGSSKWKGRPEAAFTTLWETEFAELADDLDIREEELDFVGGGFRGVGAVYRILADGESECLADGALGGVGRVGRAHDLAVLEDGALAFQHLHHDRRGAHLLDQLVVERAALVDGIERAGLSLAQLDA